MKILGKNLVLFLLVFSLFLLADLQTASVPVVAQSKTENFSAKNFQSVDGEISTSYGETATNIGDYNQDGYTDFLVGGRQYGGWQGKTWIYFTNATGISNETASFTIVGEPNIQDSGICFGHTAINAGDVNNDGITDFIAGGPGSWGAWDVGKVYVFYGNSTTYPAHAGKDDNGQIISPIKYDWLGETLSPLADFNGDGYNDVLVGAPGSASLGDNSFQYGNAYVYYGSQNGLSLTPNVTFNDVTDKTGFALSLSGTGDVNGDGLSDAVIGALNYNRDDGRAYVFFGSKTSLTNRTPDVILDAPSNSYQFGSSVAIINDLNNDGYDELAIHSYSRNETDLPSIVYVYFGNKDGVFNKPDLIFKGDNQDDDFGFAMRGIGDINKDGFNDFAVGAPGKYSSTNYQGKVYVFYGSSNLDTQANQIYTGENEGDHFGYSVSPLDLTNNGTISLIISAKEFNDSIGRVYLTLPSYKNTGSNAPSFEIGLFFSAMVLVVITRKTKKFR